VWAWGSNADGQLGNGSATNSDVPVQVDGLTNVISVAAGGNQSFALVAGGTVWGWGYNADGELGNGSTTNSDVPVEVSGLSGVVAIAAGEYATYALESNGTVWAWGYNNVGQLGNNSTTNSSVPVQVSGLSGVIGVAGGGYFGLAVGSNGTVWAWGGNGDGQLGNNTTTNSSVPVQVSGLSGVTAVAAGLYHSLAVTSTGTVWAWGYNNVGQLGNNSTTNSSVPVRVSGLSGVTGVAGGGYFSLAVESNGSVSAWGGNTAGQLGNNTTTNSDTPVSASGLSGATQVAAGSYFSLAANANDTVWAWGANTNGQLGNGTTTNSSIPIVSTLNPGIGLVQANDGSSTSSTLPLSLPNSPTSGDLVIVTLSGTLSGWSLPSGWTMAANEHVNADIAIAYHIAASGDPTTWTFTQNGGSSSTSGRIADWTGFLGAPQLDLSSVGTTSGATTTVSANPGTPAGTPEVIIAAVSGPSGDGPVSFNQSIDSDLDNLAALSTGAGVVSDLASLSPVTATWASPSVADMAVATFRSATETPGTPTDVTAVAQANAAVVDWTAPTGTVPITQYTVTPYIGSTAQTATTVTGSPPPSYATVPHLTTGATYTFTVAASNAVGVGPASARSPSVTPATPENPLYQQWSEQTQPEEWTPANSLDPNNTDSDAAAFDDDGTIVMFYRATALDGVYVIERATSTDMVNWTYGGIVISNATLDGVQAWPTCGSNYAPSVYVEQAGRDPNAGWIILTWESNYSIDGSDGGCDAATTPYGIGTHIDFAYSEDDGETFQNIQALMWPTANMPWTGWSDPPACTNKQVPSDQGPVFCGNVGTPSLQWAGSDGSEQVYDLTFHGYGGGDGTGVLQRGIATQVLSDPTQLSGNGWTNVSTINVDSSSGQELGTTAFSDDGYTLYNVGVGRADIIQPQPSGPGIPDSYYYMDLEVFTTSSACGTGYSQLMMARSSSIYGPYTLAALPIYTGGWPPPNQFQAQASPPSGCFGALPAFLYIGSDSEELADTYWVITENEFNLDSPAYRSIQPWEYGYQTS